MEPGEEKVEPVEEKEDETLEEDASLAFANAQVVRLMKKNIAKDKMIRSEVKKGMNRFLEEVASDVSKKMNEFPYAMIDYRMFENAIEPYKNLNKVEAEKKRIIAHLESIKEDCNKLIRDVEETFVTE